MIRYVNDLKGQVTGPEEGHRRTRICTWPARRILLLSRRGHWVGPASIHVRPGRGRWHRQPLLLGRRQCQMSPTQACGREGLTSDACVDSGVWWMVYTAMTSAIWLVTQSCIFSWSQDCIHSCHILFPWSVRKSEIVSSGCMTLSE